MIKCSSRKFRSLMMLMILATPWMLISADDAMVLPKDVFRFYNVISRTTADKEYDAGGHKQKLGAKLDSSAGVAVPGALVEPKVTVYRYDFITEYGVTDNMGIQLWLPFYLDGQTKMNPNTQMTTFANTQYPAIAGVPASIQKLATTDGKAASVLGDALVGLKWQILHTGSTPISSEANTWRIAIAGGAYIPTGKIAEPDTNDIKTTQDISKSWIGGLRTYVDYQAFSWFYINFFTEHQYRFKGETKQLSLRDYSVQTGKYQPGMKHTFDIDFSFMPDINETSRFESGVTFRGEFTRPGKFSGFDENTQLNGSKTLPAQFYTINPYLGVFTKKGPFPSKTVLTYSEPVAGKNTKELRTVSLQWRAFLKFW